MFLWLTAWPESGYAAFFYGPAEIATRGNELCPILAATFLIRLLLMARQLASLKEFEHFIRSNALAGVYFSGPDCGVCSALRPRLMELLAERFPSLVLAEVDCGLHPAVAGQQGVFAVPTLLVFFDGREGMRKSRAFSPGEVAAELTRPYEIFCAADGL